LALLCSSVGCFGGPTSDWPSKSSDDKGPGSPTSGADEDEDSTSDPKDDEDGPGKSPTPSTDDDNDGRGGGGESPPGAGSADAGASARLDAGAPTGDGGIASDGATSDATSSDAASSDATSSDAARSDATSSDAASSDAASGEMCTLESDRRRFGACYGVYCGMTPGELVAKSQPAGACTSAMELELACDGEIARVVSQCAESNALMLGTGRSVARCATRSDSLSQVSAACVDCYVEEVLCAATSCLASCLSSDAVGCTECRVSKCGPQFRTCSGLPKQ
jgi:hypothetical protein